MGVPRKIEMKLVKKKSARQVTFSKRRNGIFKKASELSILCGAIVAIIVFSPGGKSYAFGHPTIDYVINNFLHQGAPSPMGQNVNAKPSRDEDDDADDDDGGGDGIESLNKELEDVMNKIQEEKDKGVKLDNVLIKKGTNKFIKGNKFNIDGVGVEELAKLKANLGDLIAHLDSSIDMLDVASSLLLLAED